MHWMVSSCGQDEAQLAVLVARSAQHVSPPVHGTVGQVAPPSPPLPLLDPLPLPELLPLPEALPLLLPVVPPSDPPPLELDVPPEPLPEEELEVLASFSDAPLPVPLPLPEHPTHHTAQTAAAAAIALEVFRENMAALGTTSARPFPLTP